MYDGMISVFKERGYTSHDAVARIRGILHQKKAGHTGTLDPDAEGVLVICLGMGTKLCSLISDRDKTYVADMLLGITTDTQDISGTVLKECAVGADSDDVRGAAASFVGEYMQMPPMYSAVKKNGKRLYEYAREGKNVERSARKVEIKSLKILECSLPYVKMEITCSKGTYIRTLCSDIGEKLGCGACMSGLVRTRVGEFDIADSLTLDQIRCLADQGEEYVRAHLVSVEEMLGGYVPVSVGDDFGDRLLINGNSIGTEHVCMPEHALKDRERVRMYDLEGDFVALYRYDSGPGILKNEKMFLQR